MKKLLLIFVIIFSSRVYAQDYHSNGHLNCGDFLSSCDEHLLHIDCQFQTGWALGVITGMNYAEFGGKSYVGKGVNNDTITHALIKYCTDNPLDNTADAVEDIYLKLYEKAPN